MTISRSYGSFAQRVLSRLILGSKLLALKDRILRELFLDVITWEEWKDDSVVEERKVPL